MKRLIQTFLFSAVFASIGNSQGRGGAPPTPKAAAPIDITGYWVALVTEDWRYRMMVPAKGDFSSIPLNAEGRRVANLWDPAKDEAAGNQCAPRRHLAGELRADIRELSCVCRSRGEACRFFANSTAKIIFLFPWLNGGRRNHCVLRRHDTMADSVPGVGLGLLDTVLVDCIAAQP